MAVRAGTVVPLLIFIGLAAVGAAVMITVLLLFGVTPHLVFSPGMVVKAWLQSRGFHVPNRIPILITVGLWWGLIVALGLAWEFRPRTDAHSR